MTTIIHGDCIEVMAGMEPNSVDAIVTDPPAGIAFMGKGWDSDKGGRDAWVAWLAGVMREAYRVAKPGAHAVVWALPRTSGWTHRALEDAGWEVRDCISHLFGSGFPKSLDVGKAIDKAAGAERTIKTGVKPGHEAFIGREDHPLNGGWDRPWASDPEAVDRYHSTYAPATPEAEQWSGWGTALKPGHEMWYVARKPLAGTVAANVLAYGTGALNIDACRIDSTENLQRLQSKTAMFSQEQRPWKDRINQDDRKIMGSTSGRWPANVILDEPAAALLDAMSGVSRSGVRTPNGNKIYGRNALNESKTTDSTVRGFTDTGGASRFFLTAPIDDPEAEHLRFAYVPKASRAERSAGLATPSNHPTVKPLSLMRWLVRLVTPPGGTVLDCFAGSGSTGCAAVLEGFGFIGIEQDAEYVEIARRRIEHWTPETAQLSLLEQIA